MPQSFQTDDALLITPMATASIQVQSSPSGVATSGVLFIIGEADAGPDFSLENLKNNGFGPDQLAAVQAKYGSGHIVDAFTKCASAMADDDITGSPTLIYPIKTNASAKATSQLLDYASANYALLADSSFGKLGNLIFYQVKSAQAEVVPTTGLFTWIPNAASMHVGFRVNGAVVVDLTIGANESPAAIQAAVAGGTGLAASGGAARTTIQASTGTLAVVVVSGNNVQLNYSVPFTTIPSIGDTVVIPNASVVAGGSHQNVGAYVVTGATATQITATKMSDAGATSPVPGTITAPAGVGAVGVSATVANDLIDYAPVSFSNAAGNPSNGLGKSLEVCELTSGTDLLSRSTINLGLTTVVSWVSKSGSAQLLTSAAEYRAELDVTRQVDSVSETFTAGGEIGLMIGYTGTSAALVITGTTMVTTVVGGSGGNLSINLKDFPTISDLASFIAAQTGYVCTAGSNAIGQLPSMALDDGTFNICTQFGAKNGRIKTDGYRFFQQVSGSVLVQMNNPAAAAVSGLPGPMAAVAYLAGGTKGGTTNAQFTAALAAVEKLRGNFVIPLMSRDATADITDGLTEASSTYTIDAIHAAVRTHCLKMSKIKARRNRQGFCSIRASYATAKDKAAAMASSRISMSFSDVKVQDSQGNISQFHPWMAAVIAAAGQAAGFYRALVGKVLDISGAVQAAGDWSGDSVDETDDALSAGLLPINQNDDGAWQFVSDQTTYSKDSTSVFNSIQQMYNVDLVVLGAASAMEKKFKGKSTADVNAGAALTFLEGTFDNDRRLKLLSKSDDAPLGYKNLSIQISGPAMIVFAEFKVSNAIYFIPMKFLVTPVQQSAAQ